MKKLFKTYGWILKFIAAALILALGIVFRFILKDDAQIFVLVLTGMVLLIFGLFRIIPLVKTLKNKTLKILNIIEVSVNIIIGFLMLYFAFFQEGKLGNLYGYLLGGVFYLRGLVYFVSVVLVHEKTYPIHFWVHLAFLTLGVVIFFNGDISTDTIVWIIFALSIIVATYLSFDGGGHYKRYRYELNPVKVKTKDKNKTKEDVIVDPVIDPNTVEDPKAPEDQIIQ